MWSCWVGSKGLVQGWFCLCPECSGVMNRALVCEPPPYEPVFMQSSLTWLLSSHSFLHSAMRNTAEEGMLRDMGLLPGGQYQNQQQQQQPAGFGSRALPSSSNQSSGTEGRVEQGASAQQQPEGGASAMEVDGSGEGEEAAKPEEAAQEEAAAEGRRGRRGGRGGGGQGPGGAPRVHSAAQAAQEQADARKRFFLGLRKVGACA